VTLGSLIVVLVPAALWLIVLTTRTWRHWRLLTATVLWTLAWFGASALLPATTSQVARLVLGIAVVLSGMWPEQLGLLSISGREAKADSVLRRVSAWLREGVGSGHDAMALASTLARETFPVSSGYWEVTATLFRRSLLRRTSAAPSTLTSVTAYERAARSFWRAALERRLIRRRHRPDAWDEGVALRCYFEEFTAVLPSDALIARPVVALGGWDNEAARVIDSVRDIPMRDPIASRVRHALMAAMEDQLAVARGETSTEAKDRQRASAELMTEKWAALASRENEALVQRQRNHTGSRS
jgi:hypothetical protein